MAGATIQLQMRYNSQCLVRWARVATNGGCFYGQLTMGRNVYGSFGTGMYNTWLCDGAYTNVIYAPSSWTAGAGWYDTQCGAHATIEYTGSGGSSYPCQ